MILYLLLSLAAIVYQPYSYSAEQAVKVISLKPYVDLEYYILNHFDYSNGCVHRTFKMHIDNLHNSIAPINPIISSFEAFNKLVRNPLKLQVNYQDNDKSKEKFITFIKNPLYVDCSLKEISQDSNATIAIGFFSLIKQHTVSYKNNSSNTYLYDPSLYEQIGKRVCWPGDLILIIKYQLDKQGKINCYKENLNSIMHLFKDTKNNLYFRTAKDNMLDLDQDFDRKSKGKVIFVKDALAYLSYLQQDVNSWNLESAVDCFNKFTETGQMQNLPFWTLPRYQINATVFMLLLVIFYSRLQTK